MGRLGKMLLQLEDGTEINLGNILKEGVGNKIKDSDVMVPVDIQSRYQKTIQTHNAVSIPLSGNNASAYYDTTRFDSLGVIVRNDVAGKALTVLITWSNDGVSPHGEESLIANATAQYLGASTTIKAKWFRILVINGDSALAHTVSTSTYLKA